jgi:F0F1-type ATP synthase membrane subunit b/b'
MSSKNFNKKSDDKNDKAEEQALKKAEIVAELAPNEKTRKEAEELIETVESKSSTIAQDNSEIFDTYKQEVLNVTEEISKLQPQYAQSISKLQEEYLQVTKHLHLQHRE